MGMAVGVGLGVGSGVEGSSTFNRASTVAVIPGWLKEGAAVQDIVRTMITVDADLSANDITSPLEYGSHVFICNLTIVNIPYVLLTGYLIFPDRAIVSPKCGHFC